MRRLLTIAAALRVRTQSGHVEAALTGAGDVDVETGSSAILLHRVQGALVAKTQSGSVTVQGAPRRDWSATTGSSSVEFNLEPETGFSLDALSRREGPRYVQTKNALAQASFKINRAHAWSVSDCT